MRTQTSYGLAAASLLCAATSLSQQTGTPPETPPQDPDRERVIVTATRTPEDPFRLPFSTDLIDSRRMRERSYRTVPQALRDTPGVMVQETAHGHGSPYIRGFTSFRTLHLIDGIRLNNSAFRPGPNQYWNTIDPWSIERIEVVKGPSSVLYGSDGVGGTVSTFTRRPWAWSDTPGVRQERNIYYGGRTFFRWSDAEDSIQARGEVSASFDWADGQRTGIIAGITQKRFGDLEAGADIGNLPGTGYDDEAYDVKIEHRFNDHLRVTFAHQQVLQNDVPRTHRTVNAVPFAGTSVGSDLRRNFDQRRRLTYLRLDGEDLDGGIQDFSATVSWHSQDEERDRIRGNGNQEFQGFNVDTFGTIVQASSDTRFGRLTYGAEFYRDNVDSFFRRLVNPQAADSIQGPIADDATYDMVGVFLQDQVELTDRLTATAGLRFTHVDVSADSVRDPNTNNQISLDDDFSALTGSARLLYELTDEVNLFGGASQGFRAPNLSDLSRFDSARSGEFEIPAPNLDEEDYIQYELGTKVQTEEGAAQVAWFYTDISDQILRFPTGNIVGGETEVTKGNVGDGYIQGFEFGGALFATDEIEVFGNLTWMEGRISNFQSPTSALTNDYPTRLMPLTWQLGARFDDDDTGFWAETNVVHANRQDKLSFSDQGDSSRIPQGGTPSYTVWNIRCGYNISDGTAVTVLLENVTDADYRIHGSGQNRPGRNLIVGMEIAF